MDNYVKVWKFEDAPEDYRNLSTHGGDEDYLAFVPNELIDDFNGSWIETMSFEGSDTKIYVVDGGQVYISAHA